MTEPGAAQTFRGRALLVHAELGEGLGALQVLERELKRRPVQEIHERVRVDQVSVAIGYLELAIDALDLASQE